MTLLSDPDVLVLDEPTNHLDNETIAFLTSRLNRPGTTVLFVTHDRSFMESVCTGILELDGFGGAFLHQVSGEGSYERFLDLRADRCAWQAADRMRHGPHPRRARRPLNTGCR